AARTGFFQPIDADISEAVRANLAADRVQLQLVCDQIFLAVDIGAKVAGMFERRRGDEQMHFTCSGLFQAFDNFGGSCSPDDGVINQYIPFSLKVYRQRIELEPYRRVSLLLGWEDKTAPDIPVFDKTELKGQSAFLRVSHRRFQPGIGYTADNI